MAIKSNLRIPFASSRHATIAKQVIEVDAELQAKAVKRKLETEDDVLVAYVQFQMSVQCGIADA